MKRRQNKRENIVENFILDNMESNNHVSVKDIIEAIDYSSPQVELQQNKKKLNLKFLLLTLLSCIVLMGVSSFITYKVVEKSKENLYYDNFDYDTSALGMKSYCSYFFDNARVDVCYKVENDIITYYIFKKNSRNTIYIIHKNKEILELNLRDMFILCSFNKNNNEFFEFDIKCDDEIKHCILSNNL